MDKNRKIIWTNNDFDNCKEDFEDIDEYYEDCQIWLDDERCNLNIPIDGCIIGFAILDLWDGKHNAARVVGTNVNEIFNTSNGDYVTWFCDRYNVRCEDTHHDGTNVYLYRVAKSREQAERLVDRIAYGDMNEAQFRKATRSIRPFIAKVYGW